MSFVTVTGTMDENVSLSQNFKVKEFQCEGKLIIKKELIDKLQTLRNVLGRPLLVASGFRTPDHNAFVGGVPNSAHITGEAADVYCPGVTAETLAKLAIEVGFNGIGIAKNTIHVDIRPNKRNWRY